MKYIIGYIAMKVELNNKGELEPVPISDFIPLKPNIILNNKNQVIFEVEKLKANEQIINLNYLFVKAGDIIKNFCYKEII